MSIAGPLDEFQRRHPGAGFPLAVLYKYVDDQGGYLAALIAYYAFISLFPLLLVVSTILGFVLSGDPSAQQSVLHSAMSELPVIGKQLGDPKHVGGGVAGLVVGLLGALYGGLGVGQAAQNAMNTMWSVPRNERPNPIKVRIRSLFLLSTVGIGVIATSALSALGVGVAGGGYVAHIGLTVLSVAANAALFVFAFRLATARPLSVRDVLPGAIGAACGWQLLQTFGTEYVTHTVKEASDTNAVFALVLGLLAFFYLAAVVLSLCVEVNVVRVERLYPRALLTPFTDNVDLTRGDRRAYTERAQAQRAKGFQDIEVSYREPPRDDVDA